jgi:hypothetical protein
MLRTNRTNRTATQPASMIESLEGRTLMCACGYSDPTESLSLNYTRPSETVSLNYTRPSETVSPTDTTGIIAVLIAL